jgi:hypothetical protein
VTRMTGMFQSTIFNQPIGKWNVSKVTDMNGMFYSAIQFNQPINTKPNVTMNGATYTAWDVSKVTDMRNMFMAATAMLTNQGASITPKKDYFPASTPYTRIGSYEDKPERALPVNKGRSYTQQTCMDECPEYKYFAIQDGNQCFCGSSLSNAQKYGEKECGTNGGSYCNSLYQNNSLVGVADTEPEAEE